MFLLQDGKNQPASWLWLLATTSHSSCWIAGSWELGSDSNFLSFYCRSISCQSGFSPGRWCFGPFLPLQPTQPQRLGLLALGLDVGGVLVVRHLGRLQLFEQPSFNPIGVIVEFSEGLILLKLGSFQSEFSFLQRLAGRQWRRNRTGARGLGLAASFSRPRPSPNALVHPLQLRSRGGAVA